MRTRLSFGSGPLPVYVAKGARVYVSGLASLLMPVYLTAAGYSGVFVGTALAAILAGNVLSNLALTLLEARVGTKRLLQAFSLMMLVAGVILASDDQPIAILVACFLGNISTTGTEAGPFQSVEAGVLPELSSSGSAVRSFGRYNAVGYAASALGALTLLAPGSLGGTAAIFRESFVGFAGCGLVLLVIYSGVTWPSRPAARRLELRSLSPAMRRKVGVLSGLFSIDAFGGSFVSQYVLSYWFYLVYGVPSSQIALIFAIALVIAAGSTFVASRIAARIGNLRTMVYTHIPSSFLLLLIPVAGSVGVAVALLYARQATSQMDVPTRQALMAEMFGKEERVPAYAITNIVRSLGSFAGGPVVAGLIASGLVSGLLDAGGLSKIAYDIMIYSTYRKRFR